MQTHTNTDLSVLCNDSILFVRPLLHKCFQDVLSSGQIFWNNGLTHSCTHSVSLCIPLSLSFKRTHTIHKLHTFVLLAFFYLCKHGCSPSHRLPTLHFTWHPFNIKLLQAMFRTIRNLKMHNIVPLWAHAWRPEGKVCFNSDTTWAFRWGKFHWVISRPALTYSNHGEYLTQLL